MPNVYPIALCHEHEGWVCHNRTLNSPPSVALLQAFNQTFTRERQLLTNPNQT